MTEAGTAVRRFYESLSTGNATLADEVLTPDPKTSRCPAISARTRIIERSVFAVKHRQRSSIQQIFGRVPRRVEVDHALSLPLLRSQRSPSRARRFAVRGRAVQIRGSSVIF